MTTRTTPAALNALLAEALQSRRVTHAEVAAACRVTESAVRKWVKRKRTPKNGLVREALAQFLRKLP